MRRRLSLSNSTIATVLVVTGLLLGLHSSTSLAQLDLVQHPKVEVGTNYGNFIIQLDRERAPVTVQNFLDYVDSDFYIGLTFHRLIPHFLIQGGGYTAEMQLRNPRASISLEPSGLSNRRGTVALARTAEPDSGNSQFFINLVDNQRLDPGQGAAGYVVFGEVIAGLETLDYIAEKVRTNTRGKSKDVPVDPVVIEKMELTYDSLAAIMNVLDPWRTPGGRRPGTPGTGQPPPRTAQDTTPPRIRLAPAAAITTGARYTVRGEAMDIAGVAIVEVNGKEVQLDADGNFVGEVLLKPGTNSVRIVAYDIHKNQSSQTISIERRASPVVTTNPANTLTTGEYYALLIGVDDYLHDSVSDLDQPLGDARRVRSVLQENYTFEAENITLLANPSRGDVLDAFDAFRERVTPEDSFFVFYAGHGYWDETIEQGYWLPSDARPESKRDWIANSTIQEMIKGINSQHTLLVSDACFSGGLFRTRSAFSDAQPAIRELYKLPSRKAMTSGTLKEVPDVSVFVRYFIQRLRENEQGYVSSQQLFTSFRTAVINNSPLNQIPQYGVIQRTGDEGGDFIFVRRSKSPD